MKSTGFQASWSLPASVQNSGKLLGKPGEKWVCGFSAVLLANCPVRYQSPREYLWVICWIRPPCNNIFLRELKWPGWVLRCYCT